MTLTEFQSLQNPNGLSPLLAALWYDHRNDWAKSHELAQEIDTKAGAWVHAYLHRKEGDSSNARYWYQQAGKKFPAISLKHEWEEIVLALLNQT